MMLQGRGKGERDLLGDGRRRRLVAPHVDAESIIGLDAVPRRTRRPVDEAHARRADAVEEHVLARDAWRQNTTSDRFGAGSQFVPGLAHS